MRGIKAMPLQVRTASARSLCIAVLVLCATAFANGSTRAQPETALASSQFDIYEVAVTGVTALPAPLIETIVYPFLGPGKTDADVEAARASIEEAYLDSGRQVVAVTVPLDQDFRSGVIRIEVTEFRVGRLRVRNARYTTPQAIKDGVPSLAEGSVPDLSQAILEIAALNTGDREVQFVPGQPDVEARSFDVDLVVDERLPLHARLELNNRNTSTTKPLRLNALVRYDNLFQLDHSLRLFYQVAPQRRLDSEFFSASYTAPIPIVPGLSVEAFGFSSDSDVVSAGDASVIGDGFSIGTRAIWDLPGAPDFFHNVSVTLQYKEFTDEFEITQDDVPVKYFPGTLSYFAALTTLNSSTLFSVDAIFGFGQLGSDATEVQRNRFGANPSFIYLKAGLEHTHTLPYDIQIQGRVGGQLAGSPLIINEQLSLGGLTTVRGFFESSALADEGIFGGFELRAPSLAPIVNDLAGLDVVDEWRFYAFLDGADAKVIDPLPEQIANFRLLSAGIGTRFDLFDTVSGSVDIAFPITRVGLEEEDEKNVVFTLSAGL